MNRSILLSFDVEEFDMPLEYQQKISLAEQLEIGKLGLEAITPILNDKSIATTLFTTATYAINFPNEIRTLAQQHEIASHTYYHSDFEDSHLLSSRLKLEEISLKPVTGLRMPRMRKVEMSEVIKAGYNYDSSINPTYLPGRYNNLDLSRTLYQDEGMTRIPASVTPNFRVPLFWLAFKNMPYFLFKNLVVQTLKKDGYVCLYLHPWEFTSAIAATTLPTYTKRWCGSIMVDRLQRLINDLKKEGDFITMQDFITNRPHLPK
jgi:peptidoglycan/xylan/chitin deacetylase (PgdA/CDA1 family)